MKKLITKLVVLSVLLAICLPAYGGDILVYKTSTKAIEFDLAGNAMEKTKERGYLILDIDLATQTVTSAQHVTYGTYDDDKEQRTEVVEVVFYDDVDDYIVVDYLSSDTDAVLYGKVKDTDVGFGKEHKKSVAKSLKGYLLVFENDLGSGTVNAKLDSKLTKAANDAVDPIADVVGDIVDDLDDKYTPIVDTNKPTPDPMTWSSEPATTSATTITMTATTATDADTPPVKYSFTNVTDTGHNSGWQTSAVFTDSGLTPDTLYEYNVKAKDSAPAANTTASSADANATTLKTADTNAPTPSPMTWASGGEPNAISESAITMTATEANDTQGIDAYYFTCVTDSNFNSGWQDADVNTLPNWTANTRTWISTDLTPDTKYAYTVKARDKALVTNETLPSTPNDVNATTDADANAPTPDPMTFATVPEANGATAIYMVATTADDAGDVQYFFDWVLGIGGSDSSWQTSPIYQDTGLTANTEYGYRVQARDATLNTNVASDIKTATTAQTIQIRIAAVLAARTDEEPVTVTIPAGTYVENLTISDPNITLESAGGKDVTTIQLVSGNGINLTSSAHNTTLGGSSGHGFTVVGNVTNTTFMVQLESGEDGVEISYNDFNSTGNASQIISVGAAGADDLNISHNTMLLDSVVALSFNGTINDLVVNDNTFTAINFGGMLQFMEVKVEGATISNNTISSDCTLTLGVSTGDMNDITFSGNQFNGGGVVIHEQTADVDPNRLTNLTITGNTFGTGSYSTANTWGLAIVACENDDIDWATIQVVDNTFQCRTRLGNTQYYCAIDNVVTDGPGPGVLNAEHNYWYSTGDAGPGDANSQITDGAGCGDGDSVTTFVDYQPFWTNAAMTTDANCSP